MPAECLSDEYVTAFVSQFNIYFGVFIKVILSSLPDELTDGITWFLDLYLVLFLDTKVCESNRWLVDICWIHVMKNKLCDHFH